MSPPLLQSLRAKLLAAAGLLILVIAPVRVWFDAHEEIARAEALFDQVLADTAYAIGEQIGAAAARGRPPALALGPQAEAMLRASQTERIYYAVLDGAGRAIAGDAPLAALPQPALPGLSRRAFDAQIDGEPVRVVDLAVECGDPRSCRVRVAETLGRRDLARASAVRSTAMFSLASVVAFAIAIWVVATLALRPLRSINRELAQRTLDDLRPLGAHGEPSEVRPLIDAINQLLRRLADAAARQRHFIADAAHQLRTPLTALRTETELAVLEPHASEIDATLRRLHRGAERAARLADQLLALARAEASPRDAAGLERLDLKAIAQDAAQDWVPRALQRGADLGFQLGTATVRGRAALLRELLGNLVHNALEYAGPHARVDGSAARITVRTGLRDDGHALLEVEDNGPGIPLGERERVFERFYRAPGSPGTGSGLGLAIVHDIATAHGARVELGDALDGVGLRVSVVFPPAV